MDTVPIDGTRPDPMRSPRWADAVIRAIPFAVVVVAIYGIVHGLLRFLRGDETLAPILWSVVLPVAVVPTGLLIQMLVVKLVARRYGTQEYEPTDESSFL